MEEVKNIIAQYINAKENEIAAGTPIDNSAVKSSIILHRMYAALAEKGFVVENFTQIKTYGDLVSRLNSEPVSHGNVMVSQPLYNPAPSDNHYSIGIDIQHVAELPVVDDYRVHEFYKSNFSPSEISYCITKPDPLQSFAGIFAAKEALTKSNSALQGQPFNKIELKHTKEGKPYFNNTPVSISHSKGLAVAVAIGGIYGVPANLDVSQAISGSVQSRPAKKRTILIIIALVVSIVSLVISSAIILGIV